jgi:hypothetical protein
MDDPIPATGNIYLDAFWDQGHYYRNYTVDCANCGKEKFLENVGRHKRTKTAAIEQGYHLGEHGKWLCPNC